MSKPIPSIDTMQSVTIDSLQEEKFRFMGDERVEPELVHSKSPEDLVDELKKIESERTETINRLIERRRRVMLDAEEEQKVIDQQLKALGWKRPGRGKAKAKANEDLASE